MLKNARARTNAKTSPIERVQQILQAHKVKAMSFEYDGEGRVVALLFSLSVKGQDFWFKMPARIENVERILYGANSLSESKKIQAYTTAWANIRDWVDSQMALIDTEQVKPEEVFLPYLIVSKNGETLFEKYQDSGYARLGAPTDGVEGEVIND